MSFGMGTHSRLGGAGFEGMDVDIFRNICEAYDDERLTGVLASLIGATRQLLSR